MQLLHCIFALGLTQAQREAARIPEGMRLLPEEERLETLSILACSRAETEVKLRVSSLMISPGLHNVIRGVHA